METINQNNETFTCNIGAVSVCKKGTTNPYLDSNNINGFMGGDRVRAFKNLWNDIPQPDIEFWFSPCEGGAFILSNPKKQINGLEFWANYNYRSIYD